MIELLPVIPERITTTLTAIDLRGDRELPDHLSWRAERVAASLTQVLLLGLIDPNKIWRIAEFGAGAGGSTFALAQFTNVIEADLDAIEIGEHAANIWEQNIISREHVIISDGIAYLNSLSENGIQPYDLIAAFMLGPDTKAALFKQLANVCM